MCFNLQRTRKRTRYTHKHPHTCSVMEVSSQMATEAGGDHAASVAVTAAERVDVPSPSLVSKQRSLRAVYVLNDGLKAVAANSPESGALQCLQRACDAESAILTTVTFGRLDFGETSVLDTFYDAGELFFFFFYESHSDTQVCKHVN